MWNWFFVLCLLLFITIDAPALLPTYTQVTSQQITFGPHIHP
jgi:hypothetical protein